MKTDLSKILSVSGQHGLYEYVSQARNGAIAESLSDKKRTIFNARSRITTLADISIFTEDGEMKLQEVFLHLAETLGNGPAPSPKADEAEIEELFAKAVPDYDATRFHVSHMRKVVSWYNELLEFASLDFTDPDAEASEETAPEGESAEKE